MPRSAGSRHRVRPARGITRHRPPAAGAAPTFTTSPVYRPRRPAETPPYGVVQHHLNTFLARAEADEIRPVPRWTGRELRQYLTSGILAYGFARLTPKEREVLTHVPKGRRNKRIAMEAGRD